MTPEQVQAILRDQGLCGEISPERKRACVRKGEHVHDWDVIDADAPFFHGQPEDLAETIRRQGLLIEKYEARISPRRDRQIETVQWARRAFGIAQANDQKQRAARLLEEAIEAYQATGANPAMAHKLVDFVFDRPVGELAQELGQVQVCVLLLADAAALDADNEELRELNRIRAKDPAYFTARNAAKNAAGFYAMDAPIATGGHEPMSDGEAARLYQLAGLPAPSK